MFIYCEYKFASAEMEETYNSALQPTLLNTEGDVKPATRVPSCSPLS